MDQTARFALPFLAPGQTQKEWFHNEALQRIDMLLGSAVEEPALKDPPSNPVDGQCFLVGDAATGAWSGQDGAIAGYSDGGWRFAAPIEGMSVLVRQSGETMLRRNGSWETGILRVREVQIDGETVLRSRQPVIGDPAGGTIVDAEARAAISSMLLALRAHGLIET